MRGPQAPLLCFLFHKRFTAFIIFVIFAFYVFGPYTIFVCQYFFIIFIKEENQGPDSPFLSNIKFCQTVVLPPVPLRRGSANLSSTSVGVLGGSISGS